MCVCARTRAHVHACERERKKEKVSLYVFVCMEGVGCNLKYGDRKGFTEKVTFKQIHEEVAVQAED